MKSKQNNCPLKSFGFTDFCEHILPKCTFWLYKYLVYTDKYKVKKTIRKENSIKDGLTNASVL